jgi:hypothetical protein
LRCIALIIRLLFENQVSHYFMTLFSRSCMASMFLSIISILISPAKRISFASGYLKVNHLYIIKTKGTPTQNIPEVFFCSFCKNFHFCLFVIYVTLSTDSEPCRLQVTMSKALLPRLHLTLTGVICGTNKRLLVPLSFFFRYIYVLRIFL